MNEFLMAQPLGVDRCRLLSDPPGRNRSRTKRGHLAPFFLRAISGPGERTPLLSPRRSVGRGADSDDWPVSRGSQRIS